MKIVEGFRLRSLGREFIVVGEGMSHVNFNKMISLNESAAYLWKEVDGKDFTVEDLTRLLLDRYEIDERTAAADSASIAEKWIEAGIVSR